MAGSKIIAKSSFFPDISSQVLAWAAGIIDGEGCIMVRRHKRRAPYQGYCYSLVLMVHMTHEDTVRRLMDLFAGGLYYRRRSRVVHYTTGHSVTWQDLRAQRIIREIRPYLFTKAVEADLSLQYPLKEGGRIGTTEAIAKRAELYELLKRQKSRCQSIIRRKLQDENAKV